MPRFLLNTNLPALHIPNDFLRTSTNLMSKTLGKNILYCTSIVNPGLKMTLGGSNEPCAYVEISSIGCLGPEENKKHITAVSDYIEQTLGIPKHKLFVNFLPNYTQNVGYLGTTFYQLCDIENKKRLPQ